MKNENNIDKLLVLLNELHRRMETPDNGISDSNLAESFCFFVERSSVGENCSYARKTARLFMKRDYSDIKKLVYTIYEHIKKMEEDEHQE